MKNHATQIKPLFFCAQNHEPCRCMLKDTPDLQHDTPQIAGSARSGERCIHARIHRHVGCARAYNQFARACVRVSRPTGSRICDRPRVSSSSLNHHHHQQQQLSFDVLPPSSLAFFLLSLSCFSCMCLYPARVTRLPSFGPLNMFDAPACRPASSCSFLLFCFTGPPFCFARQSRVQWVFIKEEL